MHYLLARHGVRDYAQWKRLFDADAPAQRAAGMRVLDVFREPANGDAPDCAVFLFAVADRTRAEAFMSQPGGEQKARDAGVIPPFGLHWLEK